MLKIILRVIVTMTMTTVCFFCQSNCVENPCKNNATCQSGFTNDLLRKVFGVCVSLDLRVRFAKEVNTTFMMMSLDFQFNNNKKKLYHCLLIVSQIIKQLSLSSCSSNRSYLSLGQRAFVAVTSPTPLDGEVFVFCHFFSSSQISLIVLTYLLLNCTESEKRQQ